MKTREVWNIGRCYIHSITLPDKLKAGKWTYVTEERDVVLMAISRGYAMVRRKGCFPYVCKLSELSSASDNKGNE